MSGDDGQVTPLPGTFMVTISEEEALWLLEGLAHLIVVLREDDSERETMLRLAWRLITRAFLPEEFFTEFKAMAQELPDRERATIPSDVSSEEKIGWYLAARARLRGAGARDAE